MELTKETFLVQLKRLAEAVRVAADNARPKPGAPPTDLRFTVEIMQAASGIQTVIKVVEAGTVPFDVEQ